MRDTLGFIVPSLSHTAFYTPTDVHGQSAASTPLVFVSPLASPHASLTLFPRSPVRDMVLLVRSPLRNTADEERRVVHVRPRVVTIVVVSIIGRNGKGLGASFNWSNLSDDHVIAGGLAFEEVTHCNWRMW